MRQSHDDDAAVLRYGTSMSRTLSARRLHDGSSGSESSLQAASSFSDLPLLALPGLASRVSIAGTSASQNDLRAFFDTAIAADGHIEVDAMTVEGGLTPSLVLSTTGALASSLMFGLNNANMNTPAAAMRASLGLPSSLPAGCAAGEAVHAQLLENDVTWSLIVSILCLGALVGSASAAYLADGWGRRAFLLHNSGLYAVAALVGAAASAFPADAFPAGASPAGGREEDPCSTSRSTAAILLLLLSRVLSGVACGGSTVVVPMYLGEISPAHLRGTLGSAFLLTAVTGMLLAQVLGLPPLLGSDDRWRLVLLAVLPPAALQLLLLRHSLLESPRWLLLRGRDEAARTTLARLRGCRGGEVETAELHQELASMLPSPQGRPGGRRPASWPGGGSSARLLIDPSARRPLVLCVGLMAVQQFSGINNVFNYSSTFLAQRGLSQQECELVALLMNSVNVFVVLLSTALMDRLGRKPLLAASLGGMAAASLLLTAALLLGSVPLVVVAMVLFVLTFGVGLGPVVWLLPAELFPTQLRASAIATTTVVNWLANYVVGQLFLPLASWLGPLSFLPFAAVLAAGLLLAFSLPETRGRTLEEIEAYFAPRLKRGHSITAPLMPAAAWRGA